MKTIRKLATLIAPGAPDRWYVTDGATAVGPVTLELLGRGIDAGRVPPDGFVRHEDWTAWRRLSDLEEVMPVFDARKTFRMGSVVTLAYPEVGAAAPPGAPPRPRAQLSSASDLPESLLLLLADAVRACGAEVALVHDVSADGAAIVCSHGRTYDALGRRTPKSDPALAAARLGRTVVAEPTPGPAGRAIRARLSAPGHVADGAFMIPIRPAGKLFAFLEVGRAAPFRSSEIAAVEALVEKLVAEVEADGWGAEWIADEYIEVAH